MTDWQNNSLATVQAYNPANQITSLWTTYTNATETRTYNGLLQLTGETVSGLKDMQYDYGAGSNTGRVMSATDNISGETVQYVYDQLQRLVAAQTTSSAIPWGETYSYDGFGNLTGKTKDPSKPGGVPNVVFSINPATNQPVNGNYDANGNAPVGTWDAENHLVQQVLDGATLSWVYDPSGKRVAQFQQMSGYGQWTFYVYGATGLVGQIGCSLYSNPAYSTCAAQRANVYFGGKLIARMEPQSGTLVARGVVADRLGTVRAVQTSGGWSTPTYYPWGEAKTAGGIDGQEQFGTYVRDSTLSSQDYAMQRYYSNAAGRFFSPDPGGAATADPKNPTSWNRYGYVNGDPVNFNDTNGAFACLVGGLVPCDMGWLFWPFLAPGGLAFAPDPAPLTYQQKTAVIKQLASSVKAGKESDCDALADYIDAVAESLDGQKSAAEQLKSATALLMPNQFPVYLIPGVNGNSNYQALNPNVAPSGFQSQFQDQDPNADQAHHFAAFFQLGFVYGASVGASAASWWEKLEGTPGNAGDINLGTAAALMGSYVASGVLPVSEVGSAIRENLCSH
jgi:RHS repeat-associated protein